MKSFLYAIPAEFMPLQDIKEPYRIKVFFDCGEPVELHIHPDLFKFFGIQWWRIHEDICEKTAKEWRSILERTPITSPDSCPHDEVAQDIQ